MADNVLYHYCSTEALLGILQSKSLRLTNVRYMNDSKEISWIYELAKNVLWEKQFRCSSENEKRLCKRILSHCDELFLDETFFPGYYCSCFSKNGDSLSQWRAYSEDGKGVAIGFSRQFLDSCIVQDRVMLQEVEYFQEADLSRVNADIEQAFSKLNDISRSMTDDEIDRIARDTYGPWDSKAIFIKNAAFKEEAESRLFYLLGGPRTYEHIGSMNFFHRSSTIVPYFPLKLTLENAAISHVVLGPRNRTEHNSNSVRLLTRSLGFELALSQIRYSAASYGEVRRTKKLYPPPW